MKILVFPYFLLNFSFIFAQVSGNIVVRPDTGKISVSPLVFGSGDEMTACYSPLSQTQPLIAATKPSVLRFGGIAAEYFDWEADSLGGFYYIDVIDTFVIPVPVNFGIDSLLRLCEGIGAEPILTVNMQIADTLLAREMVEYANGDITTPMGQLRAQRGHPAPYNVSIWSLGNEPDIVHLSLPTPYNPWTFYRHFSIPFANWSWQDSSFWSPGDFANLIPQYVSAMENASPIPLSFIYSIAGDPAWIRPVIMPNINLIDYLDVHYYPVPYFDSVPDTSDYVAWLSRTDTITPAEDYIQVYRDTLSAIGASTIEPVVLEYNSGLILSPDPLWWNYLTGLFIADCIGHWMHQGIEMAGVYCISRGSPGSSDFPYFSLVRGDTASRRMGSYVLELYNTYFGDTLVYAYSDHKNTGYGIECWASKHSLDNKYVLMVVNKTLDTTYSMTIQIMDSVVNYKHYDITNNAPLEAPYNGTSGIEYHGQFSPDSIKNGWTYLTKTFVPKSVSIMEMTTYAGAIELWRPPTDSDDRFFPTVFTGPLTKRKDMGPEVYDITGRIVKPDELRPGIYFVKVNGEFVQKVIRVR